MNYGELKAALTSYLHRAGLTSQYDTFIALAQSKMNKRLRTIELDKADTLSVTANDPLVDLPSDFNEMKSLRIVVNGAYKSLEQRSLVQNGFVYQAYGSGTGRPQFFARYGSKIELSPIPSEDTTLYIIYESQLVAFTTDADTDVVLTNYPEAYIYGCMLEAALYTRDEKKIGFWGAMFDEAVEMINKHGKEKEWSGAPRQIIPLGTATP